MISLTDITSFDVIVVLIFVLFTIRGAWIGFMRQLTVFAALIGSYLLAGRYAGRITPYVGQVFENPKTVFFISFILLFVIGTLFLFLAAKMLHLVMEVTLTSWFDRILGLVLGLFKGLLVASFLYMVLSSSFISANELLAKSWTSRFLDDGAAWVKRCINDPELRAMFVPKKPAISPDMEPAAPAGPEAADGSGAVQQQEAGPASGRDDTAE